MPLTLFAEVLLEAALPVAVPEGGGARGDGELPRDEVVVRDGVGGEMGEIAEPEGAHAPLFGRLEDLAADRPRVAVPAGRCVLLGHARVRGDRPVEEVVREGM